MSLRLRIALGVGLVVPVGGGGMISGIAVAAKALQPARILIGAEPEGADEAADGRSEGKGEEADGLDEAKEEAAVLRVLAHDVHRVRRGGDDEGAALRDGQVVVPREEEPHRHAPAVRRQRPVPLHSAA